MDSSKRQKKSPLLDLMKSLPPLAHGALASAEPLPLRPSRESLRAAQTMIGALPSRSGSDPDRVKLFAAKLDLLRKLDAAQTEQDETRDESDESRAAS